MFKCELCTSYFTCEDDLNTHEKMHIRLCFPCAECPATFKNEINRNRHEKNKHHIINSPAKPNQVKTSLNTFVPYVQADLLEKNPNNLWTGDDLCIRAMDSFEKTNTSCNSGVFKYIPAGGLLGTQLSNATNNPQSLDQQCFKQKIIAENNIMVKEGRLLSKSVDTTLRGLYISYNEIHNNPQRMTEWVSRAALLSRRLKLDFNVLTILLRNNFNYRVVPVDDRIIQLTFPHIYHAGHIIMHHTQYYIFVQMIHEYKRIAFNELETIQSNPLKQSMRLSWQLKTNYILRMLCRLDNESTNFIIERFERLS